MIIAVDINVVKEIHPLPFILIKNKNQSFTIIPNTYGERGKEKNLEIKGTLQK